ncbi:MAG: hypothetical protein OXC47_02930, partial [Cyanobacteria bacterium MAG APA_bin_95]|nr:hypothetical protein [Cyanobacteria bacterium MAG APA_bin_95]
MSPKRGSWGQKCRLGYWLSQPSEHGRSSRCSSPSSPVPAQASCSVHGKREIGLPAPVGGDG